MRTRSTSTSRRESSVSKENVCRCVVICACITRCLTRTTTSVGLRDKTNRPACKRVTSSRSSVSLSRRAVACSISERASCCQAASLAPLPRAVWYPSMLAKPLSAPSGLRSSWAASPMNSSLRYSACLRALTSWWTTSATASLASCRVRGKAGSAFPRSAIQSAAGSRTIAVTSTGRYAPVLPPSAPRARAAHQPGRG